MRCSGCGERFQTDAMLGEPGASLDPRPNLLASWSLVCGLLSVIPMFALVGLLLLKVIEPSFAAGWTGVAAAVTVGSLGVILGAWGLKQGRRADVASGLKRSVAGISAGALFGIACGGCGVLGIASLPGLIPTEDPVRVQASVDRIGTFTLPEGVEPKETQVVMGTHHLVYQDESESSRVFTLLFPEMVAANEAAARSQATSKRALYLSGAPKLNVSDRFEVECSGQKFEVVEESGKDADTSWRVYSASFRPGKEWIYVLVRVKEELKEPKADRVLMSPSDVRTLFRSYVPPWQKTDADKAAEPAQ